MKFDAIKKYGDIESSEGAFQNYKWNPVHSIFVSFFVETKIIVLHSSDDMVAALILTHQPDMLK